MTQPATKYRRRGYTLLELVIALPLMTLLMLGLASAIHIAARAIPDGSGAAAATLHSGAALDLLEAELGCATAVTSRSATEIVFVTPDRSGDNVAESVRYSWSGIAGNSLMREFNGSLPEILVPSVQDFALSYESKADGALQRLQAVQVRLIAPMGTTARLDARIDTVNEPTLP